MKLYSEYPGASISMHDDKQLREALKSTIEQERINYVIETGTYQGLGSTTFVAESFQEDSPPRIFVTMEANWISWRRAKRNLSRFTFVRPLWGKSVETKEALTFIQNDDLLRNHQDYKDLFIDNIDDPIAFYSNEVLGKLGSWRFRLANIIANLLFRAFNYQGEDLLRHYLLQFRDKKPLVVLDSAGGIGFLEFSIVLETMLSYPYLILLDDIHHVKHYRSFIHIRSDSSFSIIALNEQSGWLLAKHIQ